MIYNRASFVLMVAATLCGVYGSGIADDYAHRVAGLYFAWTLMAAAWWIK